MDDLPSRTALRTIFVVIFAILETCWTLRHPPSSPPTIHTHDDSFEPDVVLEITALNYSLDCNWRYSVVINGSIPGPELRFRESDKVWIRVYNHIYDENTTMHWHGLTQRMSPFSDGTPAASQWPIPPHHYFDYEFELQPGDAGTYYYHTHVGFSAVTGFGALIVEESEGTSPPFRYDEDRVLLFSDIFKDTDSHITEGLLQNPFRWSSETLNVALNGHSRSANATADQASPSCSHGVVTLAASQTYRLRLIGATALSQVFVAFQQHHDLTLIEVDGRYVSPLKVSHVEIHTGQRYSVLLSSLTPTELRQNRQASRHHFWIQMETRSRTLITTSYAVLAYSDNGLPDTFTKPQTKPLILPNETFASGWLEDVLKPHPARPYEDTFPTLQEVTRRVFVNVQQLTNNGSVFWIQDGQPWYERMPAEPYLVSLYKKTLAYFPDYKAALANGGLDPKTRTFPAKIGEVLEIVWQNVVGNLPATRVLENHPFHAHGDHFWDVGTGSGAFDAGQAEAALQARIKAGGPIKRDTTNLYRDRYPPQGASPGTVVSWRAWRIRVQSPGVWMLHCHILQHMIMGMSTVWVFGGEEDLMPLTPEHARGYLEFGGAAYGNESYDPKVVHYWHD